MRHQKQNINPNSATLGYLRCLISCIQSRSKVIYNDDQNNDDDDSDIDDDDDDDDDVDDDDDDDHESDFDDNESDINDNDDMMKIIVTTMDIYI